MKGFAHWCRRYLSITAVLAIAFVVYSLFFQEYSLSKYISYKHTIDSLQVEIRNCTDTMNYYHQQNALLSTDPEVMERVVREQYNMTRENEDVYLFEETSEK